MRTGVPAAVVARLEAETLKAIRHPDITDELKELGAIPAPMTAAELDHFWRAEMGLLARCAAHRQRQDRVIR